ncbi:MAG: hypothetical protein RIF32_03600 [Leptospirales bacterium]|jgi:hypothetical protein
MNTVLQPLTFESVEKVLKERKFRFEPEHTEGIMRAIRSSHRKAARTPGMIPLTEHQLRNIIRQTAGYVFTKDVDHLQRWLHTGNPVARAVWAGLTGHDLPKGERATRAFVAYYFKREARFARWREYRYNKLLRCDLARLKGQCVKTRAGDSHE